MSKLVTFGCSFTKYMYPTWADIIAVDYDKFDNWGYLGGGNHLIMYSLTECIARGEITQNDTVIIMWTSVGREDRYVGGWVTEGSVYNSSYTNKMIKEFTDPIGYLLTNMSTIFAVKSILENIGCKYTFLKTCPFSDIDDSDKNTQFDLGDTENEIYKVYSDVLSIIKPSVYEVVFNGEWPMRDDTHPTPLEYCMYLENVGFILSDKQKKYATEWDARVMSGEYMFERDYSQNSKRF